MRDRQTDTHADTQTDTHADTQTDRQIEIGNKIGKKLAHHAGK